MSLKHDAMKTGHEHRSGKKGNEMKKKDCRKKGWSYILLGSLLLLWTSPQAMEPVSGHVSKTKEPAMRVERGLPAMDASAPVMFESASFGLG